MKALRVYKSSAGSGKTFTLVLEYLLLVVKNPLVYRQILAVTFTNKAANELKQRILEALFELSSGQEKPAVQHVILPYLINHSGWMKQKFVDEPDRFFIRYYISTVILMLAQSTLLCKG